MSSGRSDSKEKLIVTVEVSYSPIVLPEDIIIVVIDWKERNNFE
jgi:hypothetical protein